MADLRRNDEAREFFKANGYPIQYNDGMLAWLRDYCLVDTFTLNDLLARYIKINGYTMFIPGQLFNASEEGAWYDFADMSTMYQDDGATTPVTALGQTVGYVADKSGNGHHLTQATAGLRPTFTTDSAGIKCLQFAATEYLTDGTVDWSSESIATVSVGTQTTSNAQAGVVFGHAAAFSQVGGLECLAPTGANNTNLIGSRSSAGATSYVGLVVNSDAPYKFVVTSYIDYNQAAGSEVVGIWNGEAMAQNGGLTQENTGNFGNGTLVVGARSPTLGVPYTGYIYSLLIRCGSSTATERTQINAYINDKTRAY